MALTLSPTILPNEGQVLAHTTAEDPTFLEVPSRTTCLLIVKNESGSLADAANYTKFSSGFDLVGEQFFPDMIIAGDSIVDSSDDGFIVLEQDLSKHVIDFNQSPPVAELTGGDLPLLDLIYVGFEDG